MIYTLLYHSVATAPLSDLEVRALVVRSSQRNALRGITGLLLYGRHQHVPTAPGAFVQWIEGPEAAVRDLYSRIQADPRHMDVECLASGPVAETSRQPGRLFPSWHMESETMVDLPATLEGFQRYVREQRSAGEGPWAAAA
ncbi:MAG TPA: BLUF domain-containing protein [Rhodothermales bacterium]|nr:BLUF domain-containing protein [Rhodothermales bacterium]